jgi:hypothetical protein
VELTRDQKLPPFDGYENGFVYPFYLAALRQWASIGTVGEDTVHLWDATGKVTKSFKLPINDQLQCFSLAPDGRRFCLGSRDGKFFVADALDGKLQYQVQAFQKSCYDTHITADGRHLIALDLRTVKVYDLATGQQTKAYELHNFDALRALISADGSRIAATVYNQDDEQPILRVFDAPSGKVLSETRAAIQNNSFFISSDGRNVLFISSRGSRAGHIQVTEIASGKTRLQVELPSPYQYVGSHARISPDGRWLVATANGPEPEQVAAVAWRLGEKADPIVLPGHRGTLVSINYSTDGKQLLTLSQDSTMLIWDLAGLDKPPSTARRDTKELDQLWNDLHSPDAEKAFTAIHQLAAQPEIVAWLTRQLGAEARPPNAERVRDLIDKLDAPKFADRQKASDELARMGPGIISLLRDALTSDLSPEVKGRLQKLLEKSLEAGGLGDLSVQAIRGIEALEINGTPAALEELNKLATRQTPLGGEARTAALRLKHRLGK